MITNGLEAEVKNLIPYKSLSPLKTVGYKEMFPYFEGRIKLNESIIEIKKNSRRYAKRQITWFKKYENAYYFPYNANINEIFKTINN